MRRTLSLALTALAGLTGLALAVAVGVTPAQAADPDYVALGDSYSSGTGTRSYLADGTDCLRSVYAYPSLIASARAYALNLRACSGATVADVERAQLDALDPATSYVTISVGGNDAGFADVLTECALPGWLSNCYGAIDTARAYIRNRLPADLAALYADIAARAPGADVVVVGYPRLFNGEDCSALTWFSGSEQSALNGTANILNRRIRAAATDAGLDFANPTRRFRDHAICDAAPWLNNLTFPVVESFHPNRSGHASGYTPVVSARLPGAPVTASRALRDRAAASADRLAARQRPYTAVDRTIRPAVVHAPDLDSPRARRVARAKGIDLSSWASIDRADRIASKRQAARWRAGR